MGTSSSQQTEPSTTITSAKRSTRAATAQQQQWRSEEQRIHHATVEAERLCRQGHTCGGQWTPSCKACVKDQQRLDDQARDRELQAYSRFQYELLKPEWQALASESHRIPVFDD